MSYSKLLVNDSYKFYRNVLKSPKLIVAPMVGYSELPWRMLARKLDAQLCYSQMHSAHVILQNRDYYKQILQDISCSKDRPLLVQFAANSVENFLNAALLVEDHCDGIDLNLGCPQHIAQKGYFGAYLQENSYLLHDMISEARKILKVGVTVKIRVCSDVKQTIEYAQMLESAGCNMLTVHGRTRDQKKENSGLADWSQIRAVKANVNIPVIANGNIRYNADIHHCIAETGVDGVMVAESFLTNPYIFRDVQANVFDVIDEYLSCVEMYPTSMNYVIEHIDTLLTTFYRHKKIRSAVGSNSIKIIKAVVGRLRKIHEQDKKEMESCESAMSSFVVPASGLPYWICQPFNRFQKNQVKGSNEESNEPVEKKPKMTKHERILYFGLCKKIRVNKTNYEESRQTRKDIKEILVIDDDKKNEVVRAAERRQSVIDRLESGIHDQSVIVCLDLSWCDAMNDKEINKLSSQLGRLYGSNRNSRKPAHLYFTGFHEDGKLWRECVRKHDGFENYKIEMTSQPYMELFQSRGVVYLTPDAPTALESVEPGSVYVLGGLVDETVTKKLTLDSANEAGICTRRLPVDEYMIRSGRHSNYSTVYCVNEVFDVLLTYHNTQSWREALNVGVPAKKGYVLKEHFNKVSELP